MGRASNRKKAQRQGGNGSADAAKELALRTVLSSLQKIARENVERDEREAIARRAWCGGLEPVEAPVPQWSEGSLGDRFLTGILDAATLAPSLLTAEPPAAAKIVADPTQWNVATSVLIRAVAFDGLTIDHLVVHELLETLAPIAEAEFKFRAAADAWYDGSAPDRGDDAPEFAELDGPVFLLGACALVEAVWAVVGEDPLTEVFGVLLPVLDRIVPGLNGQVLADALIGAFAEHYRCDSSADVALLERIGRPGGDALENLVAAGAVPPRDTLRVGLAILSALAGFCRSDSRSVVGIPSRGCRASGR